MDSLNNPVATLGRYRKVHNMSDQVETSGLNATSDLVSEFFGHSAPEPANERIEPTEEVMEESANSEVEESDRGETAAEASQAEEASEESQDSETEDSAKSSEPDTEKIEIDGKTLTVKYNDRDYVKKVATRAANLQKGMNQFRQERDALKAEMETLKPDVDKYKKGFETLDALHTEAKESGDWTSFIQQVVGNDVSVEDIVQDYISKNEYLSNLTDEERSAYDSNLAEKKRLRELESKIKEYEEAAESKQEEVSNKEKSVLQKQVQTDVNSAFYEYRFGSEVGNSDRAHRLNKMAFREFNEAIEQYEVDSITPELIHKVMDQTFSSMRKDLSIGKTSKGKSKVAAKKKSTAKELTKAVEENQGAPDLSKMIQDGDMMSALRHSLGTK